MMSSGCDDVGPRLRTPSAVESDQETWVTMRWEDLYATLHQLADGSLRQISGTLLDGAAEHPILAERELRFEERIPVVERPGRTHYIKVKDIDWFEAQSQYVLLHSGPRSILARGPSLSLANLARCLDPLQFFRVHRSHIVNLSSVVALEVDGRGRHFVILAGERHVPVSQQNRRRLRMLLSRFDCDI